MFQPATKQEVACIVHFHLHNPIMVSTLALPILLASDMQTVMHPAGWDW